MGSCPVIRRCWTSFHYKALSVQPLSFSSMSLDHAVADVDAAAVTAVLSASLSTTNILFSTAKTARHARVHCSSPLESASFRLPSRSLSEAACEDPRPMMDMEDSVGICIAERPGSRME